MTVQMYLKILLTVVVITFIFGVYLAKKYIVDEYKKRLKMDISIEEMQDLEKALESFLDENGLQVGDSVWQIAEVLKIRQNKETEELKERAYLTPPDENGFMYVTHSNRIPREEYLFDFAHECAHLINGDGVPAHRPNGYNKEQVEQLADYTAAAILMPRQELYSSLEEQNYLQLSTRRKVEIVKKLCKQYGVNEIIVLRRIKEVYMLGN